MLNGNHQQMNMVNGSVKCPPSTMITFKSSPLMPSRSPKSYLLPNTSSNNSSNGVTIKSYSSFTNHSNPLSTTITNNSSNHFTRNLAVNVDNVIVKYGNNDKVTYGLNETSMNVPQGCIYGLLGPSGCGKTTLLRCLMGCLNYDRGSISLFGFKPGHKYSGVPGPGVGYMPQDIALHDDLTIAEMLAYFGRLSLMRHQILRNEIPQLIKLMDLPEETRFIRNLSGGQKRRVSFACAIINRPRLLILDEPTVGVDPLLRERIWSQLVHFTKIEKMTIIITTHYIEETKRADYIGFMLKGKLLAEDKPANFMKDYQTNSLEKVFYKLCIQNKTIIETPNQSTPTTSTTAIVERTTSNLTAATVATISATVTHVNGIAQVNSNCHISDQNGDIYCDKKFKVNKIKYKPIVKLNCLTVWLIRYKTLLNKYIVQTLRRPEAIIAQFILPLICLIIFCVCIGGTPTNIRLAIVNEDQSCLSSFSSSSSHPTFSPNSAFLLSASSYSSESMRQSLRNNSLTSTTSSTDKLFLTETESSISSDNTTYWSTIAPSTEILDDYDDNEATLGNSLQKIQDNSKCLSKILIDSLNSYIFVKINYKDENLALKDAKEGKIWGLLKINKNFSTTIVQRLLIGEDQLEDQETIIKQSTALVHADLTSRILVSTVLLALDETFQIFVQKVLTLNNLNVKIGQSPIILEKTVFGQFSRSDYLGVRDFGAPGLILILAFSISYSITVLTIVLERNDQMFERNYSLGITTNQILMGHLVNCSISTIIGNFILLEVAINLFDVPCRGSFMIAYALILMQSLTGMTMGLFISSICQTIYECTVVSNGILMLNFIVSGVLWSRYSLPYYVKWTSTMMTSTLPVESLRCILTRGLPFEDQNVYIGFIVSLGWTIVFFTLGSIIFKIKK